MALLFTLKDVVEVFSFLAIVIHAFKYKEKHIIHTGFPWLKLNKMWRFNKFTFLLSCLLNKHIEKAKKNRNNAWKIIFMIDVENLVTFKINVLIAIKSLNLMINQINLKWIWIVRIEITIKYHFILNKRKLIVCTMTENCKLPFMVHLF